MIGDQSVLTLLLHASLVVQLVMALLIGASVVSWGIIFRKRTVLRQARAALLHDVGRALRQRLEIGACLVLLRALRRLQVAQ